VVIRGTGRDTNKQSNLDHGIQPLAAIRIRSSIKVFESATSFVLTIPDRVSSSVRTRPARSTGRYVENAVNIGQSSVASD